MKKLIVILLFFASLIVLIPASLLWARMNLWVIGASGGYAAELACTSYEEQNTGTAQTSVTAANANTYVGTSYVAPADIDVCRVDAILATVGDVETAGHSYQVEIFTLSGTSLDVSQGASEAVVGVNSWDDTEVTFSFASSVSLSSGTTYAIVVTRTDHGTDGSNYIRIHYTASDEAPLDNAAEDLQRWNGDKSRASIFDGWDMRLQVFADQ